MNLAYFSTNLLPTNLINDYTKNKFHQAISLAYL